MSMRDAEEVWARAVAQIRRTCVECGRVFDLFDGVDVDEWFNGHDCEEES